MKADFKLAIRAPFVAEPNRGKPRIKEKAAEPTSPRPARIAVLMALAIHMNQLLCEGHVKDYAELAMLAGVTRARVSQVMGLLSLAPDIQDSVLSLEPMTTGREWICERALREVVALSCWRGQRKMWKHVQHLGILK